MPARCWRYLPPNFAATRPADRLPVPATVGAAERTHHGSGAGSVPHLGRDAAGHHHHFALSLGAGTLTGGRRIGYTFATRWCAWTRSVAPSLRYDRGGAGARLLPAAGAVLLLASGDCIGARRGVNQRFNALKSRIVLQILLVWLVTIPACFARCAGDGGATVHQLVLGRCMPVYACCYGVYGRRVESEQCTHLHNGLSSGWLRAHSPSTDWFVFPYRSYSGGPHEGPPRFLSRALENIAQQTFTDYTVCVINDGGDEQATRAVIEASPLGLLGSNAQDSSRVQLLTTVGDNMEAASNAGLAATTSNTWRFTMTTTCGHPSSWSAPSRRWKRAALMCTTRVVERYERENADGEFEVYEERIFHDGLPGMGLQFLFRTNRAEPSVFSTAATCTSWSVSTTSPCRWSATGSSTCVPPPLRDILLVDEPLAYWLLRPDAEGAEANSMKRQADHARFDSLVAPRYPRGFAGGCRPGAYLYQAFGG